ncbi:hypothetical protein AQUSIP_15790 [Aquicella siphonis]|uniref:Band 7 domain-containing protein n=1 Tax=Aquicella siphonis TaxID=254247 RepID=A0A5E4PGU4_9COXI|nr:hypothetical protein [Aquicella siphonis]VVC76270.1 hypothetical protein AQUSIP_15790 [Aquicella siphonis]
MLSSESRTQPGTHEGIMNPESPTPPLYPATNFGNHPPLMPQPSIHNRALASAPLIDPQSQPAFISSPEFTQPGIPHAARELSRDNSYHKIFSQLRDNARDNTLDSARPEFPTIKLDKILRASTLYDVDPVAQTRNIVAEFNRGNKEDITEESVLFGKRIDTNELRLVHRNNVPQLVPFTYRPRRLGIYATGVTEEIGVFKQTDLCIGAHGRFLVNVPQGKLVKAWEGMNPIFLGEGPHVIRHQNFRLDESPLVNLSDNVITHGNYAIVRVPRGKLAKIVLNGVPHLLEASPEPYVFDDPTFTILFHKVNDKAQYFIDASEQLIEHGSIKRIMPRTGEVAIAYDNGNLVAIKAQDKPILIDSPTFFVDGFLKINRQTLVFPSQETQEQRRRNNPADLDAINYEVFRTSDGLPIGVQLLVAYEIDNPQLTLETLQKDDIKKHIENIVVAHMLSVIQSCSSADFQKSGQNVVKEKEVKDHKDAWDIFQMPSEPSPFYSQLSKDTQQLADDLLKIGIRITQLRLEPPKILDAKIADEMAKNSLLNATARAKVSVLGLNSEITSREAQQTSEQQRIQTEREKQNKIMQAEWEAETIKIKAQAELEAARLRAEAARIEYDIKIRNMQLENETQLKNMEERAKLFDEHPGLLNLEITRVQAQAMQGIQSIVSPDIAGSWFTTPGIGLYSGVRQPPVTQKSVPSSEKEAVSLTPQAANRL